MGDQELEVRGGIGGLMRLRPIPGRLPSAVNSRWIFLLDEYYGNLYSVSLYIDAFRSPWEAPILTC